MTARSGRSPSGRSPSGRAPSGRAGGARPVTGRAVVVALVFLGALAGAAWAGVLTPVVPGASALLSLASAWLYTADKSAARAGTWRISEGSLHLTDLLGGWPGGLVARHALRHKTRKQPFRSVFWATAVVNTAVVAALVVLRP